MFVFVFAFLFVFCFRGCFCASFGGHWAATRALRSWWPLGGQVEQILEQGPRAEEQLAAHLRQALREAPAFFCRLQAGPPSLAGPAPSVTRCTCGSLRLRRCASDSSRILPSLRRAQKRCFACRFCDRNRLDPPNCARGKFVFLRCVRFVSPLRLFGAEALNEGDLHLAMALNGLMPGADLARALDEADPTLEERLLREEALRKPQKFERICCF